jgi:hypothetical protein
LAEDVVRSLGVTVRSRIAAFGFRVGTHLAHSALEPWAGSPDLSLAGVFLALRCAT